MNMRNWSLELLGSIGKYSMLLWATEDRNKMPIMVGRKALWAYCICSEADVNIFEKMLYLITIYSIYQEIGCI